MRACNQERDAVTNAVEMAVLSSLQHPGIVSVYACLTDMVEVGGGPGWRGGLLAPCITRLPAWPETCCLILLQILTWFLFLLNSCHPPTDQT
jgi:hypothetical protein